MKKAKENCVSGHQYGEMLSSEVKTDPSYLLFLLLSPHLQDSNREKGRDLPASGAYSVFPHTDFSLI